MKAILGSRKHQYLAMASIFLVTVALITGMAGCGGAGGGSYTLRITSTSGGSVAEPGEGTFTYEEGTVVNLVADPEEGYVFVTWTGDVDAIADVHAATTTITMSGYYRITANFALLVPVGNWYDLDAIRDNLTGAYLLMNDLDSTSPGYAELASPVANDGKGWEPIGFWNGGTPDPVFRGIFDGNGREIRDLFINRPDEGPVGLFSVVGGGLIKDVGVTNATVIGGANIGGLIGWNAVLVGWSEGILINSYFIGNITADGPYGSSIGGLVGWNDGSVSDSYFDGSIVAGGDCIGGVVGYNEGTLSNSHSNGNMIARNYVGGMVGHNEGAISNSYSTSNVTGEGTYIGGLVGSIYEGHTVSNSYYNYNQALINGSNIITIGAMLDEDFEEWLAEEKSLDANKRLQKEDGYYIVNNVSDFKQLLAFGQNATLKFRLVNDLDLADEPNFFIPYLAGEFNGNSHKISYVNFSFDFINYVGLFGDLASSGKISELGVENVNITSSFYTGGLVGWSEGTVSDCYVTGIVTGDDDIGGVVGENYGTVSDCYCTVSVTGQGSVGGLAGVNYGNVNICHSTGNVIADGGYIGGLVGDNYDTVSNSHSAATVTGNSHTGGLVGLNWGNINDCYSSGDVTGDYAIGGLVGHHSTGTVNNSYSIGHVTGNSRLGGLVGESYATVSHCFWDTETSGQATSDGGTGKTTEEMQDITTFSGATWDIIGVANPSTRNPYYIWNIVDDTTYPFLSWEPAS